MGLDAVVYLQPESLKHRKSPTDNDDGPSLDETAIHKRLGNISMIAGIAHEALPLIGKDSVLFNKVLYSGSHCGDSVTLDELNRLQSEINVLRESASVKSSALDNFLKDMSDLINKAREERMPIVFV